MNPLLHFLSNAPLVPAFVAWAVCQTIKGLMYRFRNHRWDIRCFLGSGGMPSSHTATVVALVYFIAAKDGLESTSFSVAIILAFIVMYDAVGVRRETGKQSRILNLITDRTLEPGELVFDKLKEIVGHSPKEVFGGVLVGIAVGALFSLFLVR